MGRKAFGSKLADFMVALANILELLFAASNFYLYCFCNSKIRTKAIAWVKCRRWWRASSNVFGSKSGGEELEQREGNLEGEKLESMKRYIPLAAEPRPEA